MNKLNDLQQTQLEILSVIHDVFEKNQLKYFLIGGSCIGAIRHQGFIPWDDDIDIALFREDYEIFLRVIFIVTIEQKQIIRIILVKSERIIQHLFMEGIHT